MIRDEQEASASILTARKSRITSHEALAPASHESRVTSSPPQLLQRDADEHRHAEVGVVEECAEALFARSSANQELLVQRGDRGARTADPIPRAELELAAREPQCKQGQELHHAHNEAVRVAEQNRA